MAGICFFIGPVVLIVGISQMIFGANDGIAWLIGGICMTAYGLFKFLQSPKKGKK